MNKLKGISTYRTPIMGFSILWVILYHIGLEYNCPNLIMGKMMSLGYGGVDFFIFLSGFGLYYSYLKDNRVKSFYYKRLRRIWPEFALVTIVFCIINGHFSIMDVLARVTTIGFWLPQFNIPYNLWYVSAIIVFYLTFPLYMYFFQKNPKLSLAVGCMLGFMLTVMYSYTYLVLYPYEKSGLIFFTSRIPLFCIGIYFGKLSISCFYITRTINYSIWGSSILFTIILLLLTKYADYWALRNGGLFYYPFIFIVPGGCLILSSILGKIPKIACFLNFFGKISFELYLVHEGLISYSKMLVKDMEIPFLFMAMGIIGASIICAYVVYLANKMFAKFCKKTKM